MSFAVGVQSGCNESDAATWGVGVPIADPETGSFSRYMSPGLKKIRIRIDERAQTGMNGLTSLGGRTKHESLDKTRMVGLADSDGCSAKPTMGTDGWTRSFGRTLRMGMTDG